MKTERFELSNINSKDILRKLSRPNRNFGRKKPRPGELIREYDFKPVKATVEQDRVYASGIQIGTVKKGSVKRVTNLIATPEYSYSSVEISGGAYITHDLDGNGNLKVVKGKSPIWAKLLIHLKK